MDEPAPLETVEDVPLAGPAELLAELGDEDDTAAARAINERMLAQGIAVAGARFEMDDIRRLLRRLRGRKLVKDLGVYNAKVGWLGFHVPPGGSGRLQFRQEAGRGGSVRLKFMGLGLGSGRSVKLSATQDFGERKECFVVGSTLRVRLRIFDDSHGESLTVDVDELLGSYVSSHASCERCFTAPDPGCALRRQVDEWDLSNDPHGLTETMTQELGETGELEIGLDLPIPGLAGLTPSIAMTRSLTSRIDAVYTFPGGARFTAYSDITPGINVLFWGRA